MEHEVWHILLFLLILEQRTITNDGKRIILIELNVIESIFEAFQ